MSTILIVDDQLPNREYLVTLLAYAQHRLLEASDGAEALPIIRAERPDLIIADILMPTMDGFELVRQLRADPPIAKTPVIFVTAHYHEREAQELARNCGVASVITKPAEPQTILNAVGAALGLAPALQPEPVAQDFDRDHLRLLTDKLSQKSDALRITNARLSALVDLNLQLASELDLRRLLQSFGRAARQIIGARYSIIAILDESGTRFQYVFTSGMDAESAAQLGSPDPASSVIGRLLRHEQPRRVRNPDGDPRVLGFSPAHPRVHSWLGVPVASPTRIYGYIGLIDRVGLDEFSEEDESLAAILAAQVGRVYQNGSLYSDVLSHAADLQREIESRKQAERALAEREEHIRLLLDSTAEAIYGVDVNGLCTFANRACARLLGYGSPALLLGRNMHQLVHHHQGDGDPYPGEDCRIFRAFRLDQPSHVDDEVFWRADSSCFPAEYWSHPIRREGKVVGCVVTFLDITERKRLEEDSRRAQQRLREVVVSSPAVLFTLAMSETDVEGLTWTSDNLREILGHSPDDAVGRDWWLSNVHPEDRNRVAAETASELLTRGYSNQEYRFRHGDGTYRWTRCDARLIRDDSGHPTEAVGAWLDISEKRRAEEEQSKLRQQLEQAQKLESVGRLAGGVAHDFNNLLTVINGYSDLLLRKLKSDDPLHESISEILKAGQLAANLTRQLLLLSRRRVTQAKSVNLNDVIVEVEKMLARVIGEDIRLEFDLDPSLGHVLADSGQLHQIVMNLAINARDAMPGGGSLTIETRNVDLDDTYANQYAEIRPGPYVQLRVSDTGIGMTSDVMAHLFEPFFTTKQPGEGTGLGLATVYGIVKQAGGSIWAYSEPGRGATFQIYLPRIGADTKSAHESMPAPSSLAGSETVLVVEDQELLRKMAGSVLRSYGYRVLEAANPGEALLHAERHPGPIHLMLTDVVMPGMAGPDLVARLKPLRPDMEVIFMSGYSERTIMQRTQLGSSYLAKPFSPESLTTKVREVLGAPRPVGRILVFDAETATRRLLRGVLTGIGYLVSDAADVQEAASCLQTSEIDLAIANLTGGEPEALNTIRMLHGVRSGVRIIAMFDPSAGAAPDAAERLGVNASLTKPVNPEELRTKVARIMIGGENIP
jgi:PAS domain S-box-containing protein